VSDTRQGIWCYIKELHVKFSDHSYMSSQNYIIMLREKTHIFGEVLNCFDLRSEIEMDLGWVLMWGKGRFYEILMIFSKCISYCREARECAYHVEYYFEGIHHGKEANYPFYSQCILSPKNIFLKVFLLGTCYCDLLI